MQRYFVLSLLATLASTLFLTGCGNKGPLYLPPTPIQVVISDSGNNEKSPEAIKSETIQKSSN
jgi:predicted small lipoprotein YifL